MNKDLNCHHVYCETLRKRLIEKQCRQKLRLPADIFHGEQDAAVISQRTVRQILESAEKCLPAVKSVSTSGYSSRRREREEKNGLRLIETD